MVTKKHRSSPSRALLCSDEIEKKAPGSSFEKSPEDLDREKGASDLDGDGREKGAADLDAKGGSGPSGSGLLQTSPGNAPEQPRGGPDAEQPRGPESLAPPVDLFQQGIIAPGEQTVLAEGLVPGQSVVPPSLFGSPAAAHPAFLENPYAAFGSSHQFATTLTSPAPLDPALAFAQHLLQQRHHQQSADQQSLTLQISFGPKGGGAGVGAGALDNYQQDHWQSGRQQDHYWGQPHGPPAIISQQDYGGSPYHQHFPPGGTPFDWQAAQQTQFPDTIQGIGAPLPPLELDQQHQYLPFIPASGPSAEGAAPTPTTTTGAALPPANGPSSDWGADLQRGPWLNRKKMALQPMPSSSSSSSDGGVGMERAAHFGKQQQHRIMDDLRIMDGGHGAVGAAAASRSGAGPGGDVEESYGGGRPAGAPAFGGGAPASSSSAVSSSGSSWNNAAAANSKPRKIARASGPARGAPKNGSKKMGHSRWDKLRNDPEAYAAARKKEAERCRNRVRGPEGKFTTKTAKAGAKTAAKKLAAKGRTRSSKPSAPQKFFAKTAAAPSSSAPSLVDDLEDFPPSTGDTSPKAKSSSQIHDLPPSSSLLTTPDEYRNCADLANPGVHVWWYRRRMNPCQLPVRRLLSPLPKWIENCKEADEVGKFLSVALDFKNRDIAEYGVCPKQDAELYARLSDYKADFFQELHDLAV